MKMKIIIVLVVAVTVGFLYMKFGWLLHNRTVLPGPKVNDGLLALINNRVSIRNFSDREIDDQTFADIMWAAFGKNTRGTRTIPTAKNEQNLKVFAIRADGAFLYDGKNLNKVSNEDLRPLFAKQDFVKVAPLTLLFVGSDREYSPLHAGSAYQNVALYCAEKGIGNVVRGMFDKAAVHAALGLSEKEFPIISQTVGWQK